MKECNGKHKTMGELFECPDCERYFRVKKNGIFKQAPVWFWIFMVGTIGLFFYLGYLEIIAEMGIK